MGFYYYRTAKWYYWQVPDNLRGGTYSECASNNALQFFSQMYTYGWTKNAIYATLGNIESEGIMNPGQFQVTTSGNINYSLGFGFVQWTPSSNLIGHAKDYAVPRGYLSQSVADALTFDNDSVCDGYTQCAVIAAEMATEKNWSPQWASKPNTAPLSPIAYTQSTLHWETLAGYWLYGFERPGDPLASINKRKENATDWHDYIEAYGASSLPQQGGTLPANFPPFGSPGGGGETPVPPVTPPTDPTPEVPPDPNPEVPDPEVPVINKIYVQPTIQYAKVGDRVKVKAVGYGNVTLDSIRFIVNERKLEILQIRNGECTVLVKNAAVYGGAFIRAEWTQDTSIEQTVLINVEGNALAGTRSGRWIYYMKPLLH